MGDVPCPRCGLPEKSITFRGTTGCASCIKPDIVRVITKALARCPVFFPGMRFLVLAFSRSCLDAFKGYMHEYLGSIASTFDDVFVVFDPQRHAVPGPDNQCSKGYFHILRRALQYAASENIALVFDIRDANAAANMVLYSAVIGDLAPGIASAEERVEYHELPVDPEIAYKRYLKDERKLYRPRRQINHVVLFRPLLSLPSAALCCYSKGPYEEYNVISETQVHILTEKRSHIMPLISELYTSPENICGLASKIEWRARPEETPCPLCGVAMDQDTCICGEL